ncbi:MAG: alpha/beta fold hydrolase [Arcicella sp.]|jgi:surfactin synthase thioesterase subunit|nr:alpha/beta fold hydrolase [Arcicella sp.]
MNSQVTVFLLPFAGGSSYSYRNYMSYASDDFKIIPLEIPGRGKRMKENLLTDIDAIVEDVFGQIKDEISNIQYVIYGHSMGTLIAYLVTKRITECFLNPPLMLFLTGSRGPSVKRENDNYYLLPDDDFISKVKILGGLPDEILKNSEILEFYLPILKADFEAVEKYEYELTQPWSIPMEVRIGTADDTNLEEAQTWQHESTEETTVKQYEGDHFFIYNHTAEIITEMKDRIEQLLQRAIV